MPDTLPEGPRAIKREGPGAPAPKRDYGKFVWGADALSKMMAYRAPNYNSTHFEAITAELHIWHPLLVDVLSPRLEDCEPLDQRTGPDQVSVPGRAAA